LPAPGKKPAPWFKPTSPASPSSSLEQVTASHHTQSGSNKLTYFRWLAGLNKQPLLKGSRSLGKRYCKTAEYYHPHHHLLLSWRSWGQM